MMTLELIDEDRMEQIRTQVDEFVERCKTHKCPKVAQNTLGWLLLHPDECAKAGVEYVRVVEILSHITDDNQGVVLMGYHEAVRCDTGDFVGCDPRSRRGALLYGDFSAEGGMGPTNGRGRQG